MLWSDPLQTPWQNRTAYRWEVYHRPADGLIRYAEGPLYLLAKLSHVKVSGLLITISQYDNQGDARLDCYPRNSGDFSEHFISV